MTTGPPRFTLPISPLGSGAAALCSYWFSLPVRQSFLPTPFPDPVLPPLPDLERPRPSFSCNWLMVGQFKVLIGCRKCLLSQLAQYVTAMVGSSLGTVWLRSRKQGAEAHVRGEGLTLCGRVDSGNSSLSPTSSL